MARQQYETPADLANEYQVATLICERWKVEAHKLPISYELDYSLTRRNRVVAFAEIKCRKRYDSARIERLGGYMISLKKIAKARALCSPLGVPFSLIASLDDGVFAWTSHKLEIASAIYGGRKDREDWQDEEPCALIPMSEFARVA